MASTICVSFVHFLSHPFTFLHLFDSLALWRHSNPVCVFLPCSRITNKVHFNSSLPRTSFGNWVGSYRTTPWWPTSSRAPWSPWPPQQVFIRPRASWSPLDPGPIDYWPTLACSCHWRYFSHTHAVQYVRVCVCVCSNYLLVIQCCVHMLKVLLQNALSFTQTFTCAQCTIFFCCCFFSFLPLHFVSTSAVTLLSVYFGKECVQQ